MNTLLVENSSAISKIEFNQEESIVGIFYTSSPERGYEFYCEEFDVVQNEIVNTYNSGESVGKKIHSLRKEGKLETIIIGESNEEN